MLPHIHSFAISIGDCSLLPRATDTEVIVEHGFLPQSPCGDDDENAKNCRDMETVYPPKLSPRKKQFCGKTTRKSGGP